MVRELPSIAYFATYPPKTMLKSSICLLILFVMMACEPFDLTRKNFPVCAKPAANIGYTAGLLDVTFFLDGPQGDIGAVGWDPGDGKGIGRVGTRVTYTYDKAGTYTVTLTIANSCDDKFTITKQITVHN
ncbi:hypothetical protein GCM10028774_21910 [Spirosoma jeollabukense]